MSNKIPWSEIRKSYGGDTETSESPNPFRRRKVEDYLQPETTVAPDEGPWEDSWGKRIARGLTGLEDVASAGAKSVGALIQGRAAKEDELLNDVIRDIYEKSGREVPDLPSSNEVPRTVGKGFSLLGDYLQKRAHSPEREKAFNPNNRWKGADLVDIITQGKLGDYLTDTDAGFLYEAPYNIGDIAGFLLPTKGIRGTAAIDAAGKLLNPARSLLGKLGFETAGDVIGSKAAKEMLGTGIQFGATMGPYGAMVNAGTMVDELKKQGKSDAEIADAISGLFAEELPADIAFAALTGNVIKGKLGNAIAPRGSSLTRKIAANAAGIPLESAGGYLSNVNQMILSEKYSGQPYGELFGEHTEAEKEAGRMGAMAGLPFAVYGGGRGVVDARAADAAYERFQKELAEGAPLREAALRDLPEISRQAYADSQNEYSSNSLRALAQSEGVPDNVYNLIMRVAQEEGVPPERLLAQAIAESNGNQGDISHAGAIGVMQLMPDTARELGVDPYDLEQNIRGGARYLKQQYDATGDWTLAHAAYNAGLGAVQKFGGVPYGEGYEETQPYVDRINGLVSGLGGESGGGDGRIGKPGYMGEGGKGENTYWVANENVRLDKAQPGLLDAIDMLGKKVYDDTGVQLVVTSGNDGGSHADGEHSHYNGWKVDIADAGANGVPIDADGVLFTKDFMPTEYCQELIAYGRKLGLGMNLEAIGTSNVHLDVALDGTQWQGSLGDAGGFNPRNADDRPTIQQRADELVDQRFRERVSPQRQEQPQPPEPMQARQIDFKATDDETKSVFDGFAKEQANKAIADGDGETALFFRDMFNGDEFQNTEENRAAIAERYGDELTQFAQTFTPALPQATEQAQTVSVSAPRPQAQPAAGGTANKYIRNNDNVMQAGNNFLEELRAKGTQADAETSVRLLTALQNNDTDTVRNILEANNRPIVAEQQTAQTQPQQQQQAQPQNDPVKQNGTPENVLAQQQQPQQQESTQPQQPAKPKKQPKTPEEKAQSALAKPLQSKKSETRRKAGNAVIFLADENGIEISDADRKSLGNGKTAVVNQWRDILIGKGILSPQTTQPPPKQSSPAQSQAQQQTQETAQPAEKPLTLQDRMQQVVNEAGQQRWQETQDKYKRRAEYTKLQRRQDVDEAENARVTEANVARFNNTERNEEYQELQRRQDEGEAEAARVSEESNKRFAQEQQERERQAKQEKELQELQTRQEAEKRAAEESTQRAAEQDKEIAQRQSLPSDIAAALAPPSLSKNALKKQGNAIADLINSTPFKDMFGVISLPSGLEPALRNGNETAINAARNILSRRGVRPVEWTQQEAEIISEDTETPAPYEPPQQNVGRHEETVITHETPDRPPQIELDSALTAEPVAHDKAKRKRQGEAIHRVINSPQFIAAYGRVKLSAALESTLQRGEYKAIETVQRMLRERGIIPQPEAQPEQATKPEKEPTSTEEKAHDAESERLEARMDDAEALEELFDTESERITAQAEERPVKSKSESRTEEQKAKPTDAPLKETKPAEAKTEEKPKPEPKSMEGEADTRITNVIEDESTLTPPQKLLQSFSEKLGVPLRFFRNPDGKFHGSFSNGVLFLNANSKKGLGEVFWHESFHWLKANNPKLYAKLVDAAGITPENRKAFLERTGRKDLKTNEGIDEEILADQMDDVAKRTGLFQSIAGKNRGVVERVMQWLKDTMNKFIETFRNPTGRLTTKQAQALAKEFGQIARQLKDENGNAIFRVNNRTGDVEVVEGRKARELSKEEIEAAAKSLDRKLSFAGIKALTADLNAFDKAEEMANKGASREEIFKETKLVRGKDGLYRFEIPDNLDKIDFAPLVKNGRATLGEIYKNSKLYAAYPKLRDIEVVATSKRLGENGAYWLGFEYDPVKGHTFTERISINLSPKGLPVAARKAWAKQQRGSLIHEIQHAIQAREQFATGGNAQNVRAKLADAQGNVTIAEGENDHDLYWRLGGEQEAREAQDRAELKALKKEEKRLRSELIDIVPTLPPDTQKKFKDFITAVKAKSDDIFDIADSLPDDANKDILTDWAAAVDDIEEFSKDNGRIPQIHGDNAIIIWGEYDANAYSAQSVSNPNDNSSESLGQKIKNFASTVFNGKPQSKNHKQFIVDKLEELTRYKTYFNTNAKNEADVIVDSFQKIIRARHAYDFEKLLPATGEPIAKVLGLNPSAEMSNYIADWMMTGAINNTSKEATAFQKAMCAHPAEAELLQSIRDTFQEMANMTAEEAVESNIVRDKKSKTFREWLGEKFSKEEWVDDLHPIKRAYDQTLAKVPPAVADIIKKNFDPYMSASLFRGKGAIADMMIGDKKEVTDEDVDIVRRVLQREFPNVNFSNFKPLAAIAKMVDYDVEGLERYALAKLDKEMHEKKNSGDPKYADLTPSYTEAQCDEIIKAGKAKYDAAQRELVNYANTLSAIQYSTGVISANQFYQRVNGWENYVPTARVFEEYEDISVDKSDSSKHKTGSKRRVYSPLGKLAANTDVFIRQSLQNRARLEIVTMARLGNFGDIIAETPKGYPQGHTIHFKENGKMKYLVTPDESLARAVEAIQTPADANIVVQAFKTAGMVMRGLYTMFNAEFMVGNPFRDLADAFIHNKYGSRNPFVAIPAMVSAAVSGFAQSVGAQIKTEEFRTFLAEGGAQSGFSYEITEGANRRIDSFGKKSLAKNVWDKFLMIAEASENMTRFSTFKTAKDNLAKQHGGVATPHDLKLAAMQARRATVDFARSGRTMRGVNKVALFSNAAMQSLALWGEKINAARKSKEGRQELFAAVFKTVMGGVMPALALAALNFSDDDRRKRFEQRPTWEKDTYWIFGDGLRVPKGMDLGIKLTSALTEEFAMWMASNKPVEWKRIVNNIGRGLPSITTTIFTPAVESYMNYSIFKDAPIVPYGQKDDPKYKQYGKNTSWVAKQLGNMFNQSPRVIDHLIAGYGGSMLTALTGGSDGIPIVRRFMFDPDKNPRIVQDYYKALEEQEEMLAEYKARRADGEKVELPEDYDRGLHARLKKSREAMTKISKAEMRIMNDPKLDADKRKEKLRELEKRRVALCERVLGKAR